MEIFKSRIDHNVLIDDNTQRPDTKNNKSNSMVNLPTLILSAFSEFSIFLQCSHPTVREKLGCRYHVLINMMGQNGDFESPPEKLRFAMATTRSS